MIAEKDFAGRQTQGARPLQEDAYAFSEIVGRNNEVEGLLVVVADGMGGHTAGERASELALKTFINVFHRTSGLPGKRLSQGLVAANDAIRNELSRDAALEGMGTTLVAASLTPAGLEWVSVGDSPLYLLRGAKLKRLNADHSLRPILNELAERGELPSSENTKRVSGNLLRAALTGEEIAMTDQSPSPLPLQEGDLIIVATDGIQTLNPQEIIATCADPVAIDASVLAGGLVQAVVHAGNPKQDNTTVAILKPQSVDTDLVLPL